MYRFADRPRESAARFALAYVVWALAAALALFALWEWGFPIYVAVTVCLGWPLFYGGVWILTGEPPHRWWRDR